MNLQTISSLLRTISQPARIEILLTIGSGEACVCHLETVTGQRQAYISQQLMELRKADIVTSQRDGRNIYYQLKDSAILELIKQAGVLAGIDESEFPASGPVNLHGECPCPKCKNDIPEVPEESIIGNLSKTGDSHD